MRLHIKTPLYGTLVAGLLGFAGTGLTQSKVIEEYQQYLDGQQREFAFSTARERELHGKIDNLRKRIDRLEQRQKGAREATLPTSSGRSSAAPEL